MPCMSADERASHSGVRLRLIRVIIRWSRSPKDRHSALRAGQQRSRAGVVIQPRRNDGPLALGVGEHGLERGRGKHLGWVRALGAN
jgi:hypothetical protein